jgi:hypothetical protein
MALQTNVHESAARAWPMTVDTDRELTRAPIEALTG